MRLRAPALLLTALLLTALLLTLALSAIAARPAAAQDEGEPPPPAAAPTFTAALADGVACLRRVDRTLAFVRLRLRIPTAERMGLAHVDDRGRPGERDRALLTRYAAATAACAPAFADGLEGAEAAVAALLSDAWTEQSTLLARLAGGEMTWGEYNRASMTLDRRVREGMAAARRSEMEKARSAAEAEGLP